MIDVEDATKQYRSNRVVPWKGDSTRISGYMNSDSSNHQIVVYYRHKVIRHTKNDTFEFDLIHPDTLSSRTN